MRVAPSPGEVAPAIQRQLVRGWFLITLRGLVAVAFSLLFVLEAHEGLAVYAFTAAAYCVCDGCVTLPAALQRAAPGGRLWLFGADALVSFIAALAILTLPELTPRLLVMIIALRAAIGGIVLFITAIRLASHTAQLWMVLAGLASIGFAVVCFVVPFAVAAQIARSFTVYMFIRGSLLLGLGWTLRPNGRAVA